MRRFCLLLIAAAALAREQVVYFQGRTYLSFDRAVDAARETIDKNLQDCKEMVSNATWLYVLISVGNRRTFLPNLDELDHPVMREIYESPFGEEDEVLEPMCEQLPTFTFKTVSDFDALTQFLDQFLVLKKKIPPQLENAHMRIKELLPPGEAPKQMNEYARKLSSLIPFAELVESIDVVPSARLKRIFRKERCDEEFDTFEELVEHELVGLTKIHQKYGSF